MVFNNIDLRIVIRAIMVWPPKSVAVDTKTLEIGKMLIEMSISHNFGITLAITPGLCIKSIY